MPSVVLPTTQLPNSATPELVSFGGVLTPSGGGPSQRLNRLGDRYRLSVTLPTRITGELRVYIARLRQALTDGAILAFPQPDITIGSPGSPVVAGSGQAGSTLNLRNFTPNYALREGQFFSIIHNGRRYLHSARAQAIVSNTGTLALPITPMLRISPADGAVCEFGQPKIEGFLEGNSIAWTYTRARTKPPEFVITEAE